MMFSPHAQGVFILGFCKHIRNFIVVACSTSMVGCAIKGKINAPKFAPGVTIDLKSVAPSVSCYNLKSDLPGGVFGNTHLATLNLAQGSICFSGNGDCDVSTRLCNFNNQNWKKCDDPTQFQGVTEGEYPFQIRGVDPKGYEGTSDVCKIKIDKTDPIAATSLTLSPKDATEVYLQWEHASDPVSGITKYDIFSCDVIDIATKNCTGTLTAVTTTGLTTQNLASIKISDVLSKYLCVKSTNGVSLSSVGSCTAKKVSSQTTIFTKVAAGLSHTCALTNSGEIWCWGDNTHGQLGNGTNTDQANPVKVILPSGVTGWTDVSVGRAHSCAIGNTGKTAYCWGANSLHQLGNNMTSDNYRAGDVAQSTTTTKILMLTSGENHNCILISDGGSGVDNTIECWGSNAYGQNGTLGTGDLPGSVELRSTPVRTSTNTFYGATHISAGQRHTCAIKNGLAYCFGENFGVNAVATIANSPLFASGDLISAGGGFTCALFSGNMRCWGLNTQGYLGDGSDVDKTFALSSFVAAVESTFTSISTGLLIHSNGQFTSALASPDITGHSCAVAGDNIYCWGDNNHGQLGDGTQVRRLSPSRVIGLPPDATSTLKKVSANGDHTCAVVNGGVWCWGGNYHRKLGDGTESDRTQPISLYGNF